MTSIRERPITYRQMGWLRTILKVFVKYFFSPLSNQSNFFSIFTRLVTRRCLQNFRQIGCVEKKILSHDHAVRSHPANGVTSDTPLTVVIDNYLTSYAAFCNAMLWRQVGKFNLKRARDVKSVRSHPGEKRNNKAKLSLFYAFPHVGMALIIWKCLREWFQDYESTV